MLVQAGGLDLFDDDGVGFLQDGNALRRDLPEDANGQAGTGEGLAVNDLVGHAEVAADTADFILEEVA